MPVTGRKPKPEGQKRNRHAPTYEWVEVFDTPFVGAPKLPNRPGGAWPARTRAWWKAVSTMPHCVLWSDADWSYAFDAAVIAALLHEGDLRAAGPLERREKVMGTTIDYRRDLRIRYVSEVADQTSPAPVADLADYRAAFGG